MALGTAYTIKYRVAVMIVDSRAASDRVAFRTEGQSEDRCRLTHLALHRAFDGKAVSEDTPAEHFRYAVRLECVYTPVGEQVSTVDTDTMFGAWNEAEYRAYKDHGILKDPSGFSELGDEEDDNV